MSATLWKYFPTYSDESRGILFLILSGNSLLTYVDVIDLSVCISRYVSYVGRRMAQQEGECLLLYFCCCIYQCCMNISVSLWMIGVFSFCYCSVVYEAMIHLLLVKSFYCRVSFLYFVLVKTVQARLFEVCWTCDVQAMNVEQTHLAPTDRLVWKGLRLTRVFSL